MSRGKTFGLLAGAVAILAVAAALGLYLAGSRPDFTPAAQTGEIPVVPAPGQATMLDLGATECVPCKMMLPIIEELRAEYAGRAAVLFIDVWKHPDQGRRFGVQSIPTQIFFDAKGQEVTRHVGFLDKKSIKDVFAKLGVR